jgi:hypothetical protein
MKIYKVKNGGSYHPNAQLFLEQLSDLSAEEAIKKYANKETLIFMWMEEGEEDVYTQAVWLSINDNRQMANLISEDLKQALKTAVNNL